MPGIFLFRKGPRTSLFPCKDINKYGRRLEDQRCSCLTISVIVFNMASRHLLNMEHKGYSGALGTFLMGGNSYFTGYLDASNSVAVNFEELYGNLGQRSMTKELARRGKQVVFIYRVPVRFDE